ncbi:MAG: 16S rRNA (adenine(1518)-N(6)/adenine(1519)-N(6))-dimethyltransferase RsmA [Hyphomonadaceae bacterium]|jgi:16S rRNA (adenine1518-N6/adenine1519-N6)-dimethyltransferase|nr:16S rRNA (adenine(1518)-N(6)/adenine(1519)-N(6))-dimethyltransferase RsmA [Hyphomonadaceae bacterium]
MSDLRASLEAAGLFARKSLGQHFLLDLNITRKIVKIAGLSPGQPVLEIGPGPGGLTRALLDSPCGSITAIEADARFVGHLETCFAADLGRLTLIHADALKIDAAGLFDVSGPAPAIVANLPYNVGTPLLVNWLKGGRWWDRMCLMFQLEVCQRIVATPGSAHYGRLAVLVAAVANARLAMTLPPGAFVPPPKVDSGIVVLEPLRMPFPDLAALETVTAAAFGQRRKMLRVSLRQLGDAEALLGQAGVEPAARPETLDPQAFQRLATAWRALTPI